MGAIEIGLAIYFTISAALLAFSLGDDSRAYILQQWRWKSRMSRAAGEKRAPRSDAWVITAFMIVGFLLGPILLLAALILPERD